MDQFETEGDLREHFGIGNNQGELEGSVTP